MSATGADEGRGKFSWARGVLHGLAISAVLASLMIGVGLIHGVANPNKFAEQVGDFFGKVFLPAVAVSYLLQTGRRSWALGLGGAMIALALLGVALGFIRSPSVAEMQKNFNEGCAAHCPGGADGVRCRSLCGCVWDGIRAAHPDDRSLVEFLKSASADRSGFEKQLSELATGCAARVSIP